MVGDAAYDATLVDANDAGGDSPAAPGACPATCTSAAECAPWAALCSGWPDAGAFACRACSGPDESLICDQIFCGYAYPPRFRDGGTVYGDCDTTTGRCRCFVIQNDGGRSGYLDDGGASCPRGASLDAGNEGSPLCAAPPTLADSGTCSLPPFTAQVFAVTFWIEDGTAAQGGWAITLNLNETATVGGHVYRNSGGGLVGGGPLGSIDGDALLDVDGTPNALRFHHTGCASALTAQSWDYPAALTRSNPVCSGCATSTIARHYSITRKGDAGPSSEYDFFADEPPRSCGAGVDLLGFVTKG